MIRHIQGERSFCFLISDSRAELLKFLARGGVRRRCGEVRQLTGALSCVRLSDQESRRLARDLAGVPRTSWRQLWSYTVEVLARRLRIPAHIRRIRR